MFSSIQFAGHSAVFIHANNLTIAVDPWLEGNPMCPDELKSVKKLDIIALTHGHADHACDVVRLQKATGAQVIATYELAMILCQEGVDQQAVLPMNKGGTITEKGVKFTLTNAYHSSSYDSAERGTLYAGEAAGLIINDGKHSIYHAGDTALFADLALIAKRYEPTVALLPIGDRFTMGGEEAAQAAQIIGAKRTIPVHYKTFPLLDQSADLFTAACNRVDIEVTELAPGESLAL